jgi:hypothetical protein
MDAKTQNREPYVTPTVTTHSTGDVLAMLGPAQAIYGDPPFPP